MVPVVPETSKMVPPCVLTKNIVVEWPLRWGIMSIEQIAGWRQAFAISNTVIFWRLACRPPLASRSDQSMSSPSSHPETKPSGQAQRDWTLPLWAWISSANFPSSQTTSVPFEVPAINLFCPCNVDEVREKGKHHQKWDKLVHFRSLTQRWVVLLGQLQHWQFKDARKGARGEDSIRSEGACLACASDLTSTFRSCEEISARWSACSGTCTRHHAMTRSSGHGSCETIAAQYM